MTNYMDIINSNTSQDSVVIVDFLKQENKTVNSTYIEAVKSPVTNVAPFSKLEKFYYTVKSKIFKNSKKPSPTILIPATDNDSMRGAGIRHNKQKYITHSTLPSYLSAIKTFDLGQKIIAATLGLITIISLVLMPIITLNVAAISAELRHP